MRDGSNMDDRANDSDDADFARIHGTTRIGPEAIAKDIADILGTIYEGTPLATAVESIRFIRLVHKSSIFLEVLQLVRDQIDGDGEEDVPIASSFSIASRYSHITICVRRHSPLNCKVVES